MDKPSSISVIIPAYNSEKTLERAIGSIKQRENVEIIVVENGSTDGTYELARSLSKKDSRIMVFQSPKGVSNARNKGIEEARGKWISFLDADDYFSEGTFNILSNYYDKEADLIVFGHRQVILERNRGEKNITVTHKDVLYRDNDIETARVKMIENPTKYMLAVSKLFRRDILIQHSIFFDPDMSLSEDSDFVTRYLMKCNKILFSKGIIYDYVVDNVSTMRSYDADRVKKFLFALNKTSNNLRGESYNVRNAFGRYVLLNLNIMMTRGPFSVENTDTFFTKTVLLYRVSNVRIVKESLDQLKVRDLCNLRMIPIFLIKYKLYTMAGIIFHIRSVQNYKTITKRK